LKIAAKPLHKKTWLVMATRPILIAYRNSSSACPATLSAARYDLLFSAIPYKKHSKMHRPNEPARSSKVNDFRVM